MENRLKQNGGQVYSTAFLEGLKPDPDYTVSQWADAHRMLSQKAASEPGRWRTSRTPYLREIMDCLSPSSPVEEVVFMAGAQVGKTETGQNWLGFIIHHAPGPVMMVQPTTDTAKRVSKQRIAPMVEESPVLRDRISDNRSRDGTNAMLSKEFPGGVLIITGANSAVGLRSMPVRYLFLDEVDGFPQDVDGEGDPIRLAEKRTTTFSRRKIYKCSTPTVKETSRIEREYMASDQRRYFVPCPDCGHMQHLKWGQIKWVDDKADTAAYACEECGILIPENKKSWMLERGEWRATAPDNGHRVAGFHLSSLYSPLGWKSWASIVREFLEAKGDASLLKTWVNTVLGESFEEEYSAKLSAEGIASRREMYTGCPDDVLVLTAGVDVQDNRLAMTVWGWGEGEEAWVVDHQEIYGDPSRPELWKQLDSVLTAEYEHESGVKMKIEVAAIDSGGHFTSEVYAFARERAGRVIAIKGQSQKNKPVIGKPTKVDINFRGQVLKSGGQVYPVGSDTAKTTIYARLKNTEKGPGYIHFHGGLDDEYFAQLTSEKQVVRFVRGFATREWVKKARARNEALDCAVYAYAAMQYLYTKFNRKAIWEQLAKRLNALIPGKRPEKVQKIEDKPPKISPILQQKRIQPRIGRNNFVKGW